MKSPLTKRILNRAHSITRSLILSLPAALLLSLFIYLHHWSLAHALPLTLLALAGLTLWLLTPRSRAFWLGFLVAIFWFWWVGLSFRFTDYQWLALPVVLGGAAIYGALFYFIAWLPLLGRAVAIAFLFDWVEPLGFVWFKPELILMDSLFSSSKVAFVLLLLALGFALRPHWLRSYLSYGAAALFLIAALLWPEPAARPASPPLSIKLVESDLSQALKWQPTLRDHHARDALAAIDAAIEEGHDLVVLPEAAFPLFLNLNRHWMSALKERSEAIAIFVGGLHHKEGFAYNSAFFFHQGQMQVADKVYLVPFGEGNPLPDWLSGWVNTIFFEGAEDYRPADKPTDFTIGENDFRAAICYEATVAGLFENAPPYMIAISNNGWFVPSTEPTLQRLMMQLQARRHGVLIFHASNESPSEVIF
jgi:apolipoprotein N-acyltransferase